MQGGGRECGIGRADDALVRGGGLGQVAGSEQLVGMLEDPHRPRLVERALAEQVLGLGDDRDGAGRRRGGEAVVHPLDSTRVRAMTSRATPGFGVPPA